eukprot:10960880-Alexandrium_andersonii.AAC.1
MRGSGGPGRAALLRDVLRAFRGDFVGFARVFLHPEDAAQQCNSMNRPCLVRLGFCSGVQCMAMRP